jgi:predicted tellurium resistance membrane protein TerC
MNAISAFYTLDGWISLMALTLLEIVLGIDNIIFISILTDRLPAAMKKRARFWGLIGALIMRIILLSTISYLTGMTSSLFELKGIEFSGRDLILMAGGVFLLYKSSIELHEKINKPHHEEGPKKTANSFANAILQIILIDIVFSFDSILTAIAVSNNKPVMIGAVIVSMIIMMIFSTVVAEFINRRPTMKVLALTFLLMIGGILTMEAFHIEVSKNYIYSALAFSFVVELLNNRMQTNMKKHKELEKQND